MAISNHPDGAKIREEAKPQIILSLMPSTIYACIKESIPYYSKELNTMTRQNWAPERILKKHVISAAKHWDANNGHRKFRNSRSYDVIVQGKAYPPKAICSYAHELATGIALSPNEFGGAKDGIWHRMLKNLGFPIIEKRPELDFYAEVAAALKHSPKLRAERLSARANIPPERIETTIYRYNRNRDVVAERLHRAHGVCEECDRQAPFNRKKDGAPFLEVHHVQPLSQGGLDTVENTIAVCPNCHAEMHDKMGLDALSE